MMAADAKFEREHLVRTQFILVSMHNPDVGVSEFTLQLLRATLAHSGQNSESA